MVQGPQIMPEGKIPHVTPSITPTPTPKAPPLPSAAAAIAAAAPHAAAPLPQHVTIIKSADFKAAEETVYKAIEEKRFGEVLQAICGLSRDDQIKILSTVSYRNLKLIEENTEQANANLQHVILMEPLFRKLWSTQTPSSITEKDLAVLQQQLTRKTLASDELKTLQELVKAVPNTIVSSIRSFLDPTVLQMAPNSDDFKAALHLAIAQTGIFLRMQEPTGRSIAAESLASLFLKKVTSTMKAKVETIVATSQHPDVQLWRMCASALPNRSEPLTAQDIERIVNVCNIIKKREPTEAEIDTFLACNFSAADLQQIKKTFWDTSQNDLFILMREDLTGKALSMQTVKEASRNAKQTEQDFSDFRNKSPTEQLTLFKKMETCLAKAQGRMVASDVVEPFLQQVESSQDPKIQQVRAWYSFLKQQDSSEAANSRLQKALSYVHDPQLALPAGDPTQILNDLFQAIPPATPQSAKNVNDLKAALMKWNRLSDGTMSLLKEVSSWQLSQTLIQPFWAKLIATSSSWIARFATGYPQCTPAPTSQAELQKVVNKACDTWEAYNHISEKPPKDRIPILRYALDHCRTDESVVTQVKALIRAAYLKLKHPQWTEAACLNYGTMHAEIIHRMETSADISLGDLSMLVKPLSNLGDDETQEIIALIRKKGESGGKVAQDIVQQLTKKPSLTLRENMHAVVSDYIHSQPFTYETLQKIADVKLSTQESLDLWQAMNNTTAVDKDLDSIKKLCISLQNSWHKEEKVAPTPSVILPIALYVHRYLQRTSTVNDVATRIIFPFESRLRRPVVLSKGSVIVLAKRSTTDLKASGGFKSVFSSLKITQLPSAPALADVPSGEYRIQPIARLYSSNPAIFKEMEHDRAVLEPLQREKKEEGEFTRIHAAIRYDRARGKKAFSIFCDRCEAELGAPEVTFEPDEQLNIMENLLNALQKMHKAGYAHNDIKPGNLMFIRDAATGKVYGVLIDFNLAKKIKECATTGFYGTPEWTAPEGGKGPQADMYALGSSLYALANKDPDSPKRYHPSWIEGIVGRVTPSVNSFQVTGAQPEIITIHKRERQEEELREYLESDTIKDIVNKVETTSERLTAVEIREYLISRFLLINPKERWTAEEGYRMLQGLKKRRS